MAFSFSRRSAEEDVGFDLSGNKLYQELTADLALPISKSAFSTWYKYELFRYRSAKKGMMETENAQLRAHDLERFEDRLADKFDLCVRDYYNLLLETANELEKAIASGEAEAELSFELDDRGMKRLISVDEPTDKAAFCRFFRDFLAGMGFNAEVDLERWTRAKKVRHYDLSKFVEDVENGTDLGSSYSEETEHGTALRIKARKDSAQMLQDKDWPEKKQNSSALLALARDGEGSKRSSSGSSRKKRQLKLAIPEKLKKKPILIAAAALLVLIILFLIVFLPGRNKTPDSVPDNGQQQQTGGVINGTAYAAPIPGTPISATVSASSVLTDGGTTFSAERAIDGDISTCWQESAEGMGEGEWLMLEFAQATDVNAISLRPGAAKTGDTFMRNARPERVEFSFSDGSTLNFSFNDTNAWQSILLPETINTSFIKATILSTYPGTKYEDLGISEFQAFLVSETPAEPEPPQE